MRGQVHLQVKLKFLCHTHININAENMILHNLKTPLSLVLCSDYTPEGKGSRHFRHISWDSLRLITFWSENSDYQSDSWKCARAYVQWNFLLILRTVPSHRAWSVLYSASVRCEISFLIIFLRIVPRYMAKVTRPSPFGVWSGHETTLSSAQAPLSENHPLREHPLS